MTIARFGRLATSSTIEDELKIPPTAEEGTASICLLTGAIMLGMGFLHLGSAHIARTLRCIVTVPLASSCRIAFGHSQRPDSVCVFVWRSISRSYLAVVQSVRLQVVSAERRTIQADPHLDRFAETCLVRHQNSHANHIVGGDAHTCSCERC